MSFPLPFISGNSIDSTIPTRSESYTHKTYSCMINNIGPIQWTVERGLLLNKILRSCEGNFLIPQVRITWPNLDERFASNLEKLLISLYAYYDSNNPVISQDTLIDILSDKDAAETLKHIRVKSMMKAWGSEFIETPDWWDKTLSYVISDIGDIFYYKYCFFWEEENNDYEYQQQPLHVNEDIVKLFKKNLEFVLDELDFNIDFETSEVLYQPRSSKVCKPDMKSESDYQIRYSKAPTFRYGPRKPGKRCIIPVHPGGVRDTIINQIEDLNSILGIEKILSRAMKKHPCTIINNNERMSKALDEFQSKYTYFYCRDIEKEGITKPRYLLKIMLTALSKRCPKFSEVCTPDFFDGDWCQIDDKVIHSDRGHGLGMANSLTTLMQIVIYRMVLQVYLRDHYESEDFCDFFTLNDDCVYGLNLPEDEVFEFSQLDHEILEELGLIRKKTKSFIAKNGFVFLEIYYPWCFNRKDSIVKRTMLLPYSAVNIVHAKDLMSLMTSNPYLDKILNKWGYEFYPDEVNQPRHFGGWFSKNFYGVDISLDIDIDEFTGQMSRAAQAVLESDKSVKRKIVKYSDPFHLLPYQDIDSYIFNKLPIAGSALFSHFERLRIRTDFNLIYDRLYQKRQRIYNKAKYVDFKTYLSELIEHSDKDIFISKFPHRWVRDFDIDIMEGVFSDPYRYSSPISAAIRKLKGVQVKGIPSSYWPITSSDSSFSCSVLRSEIAEMNLDYYAFDYTDEDVVLPNKEEDFQEFLLSWKNPVAVGKYCQIRFNRLMIPDKKPSIMKYKEGFFKRPLTRIEYLLLQGLPYHEIESYLDSSLTLEEFLDEYKDRNTPIERNITSSESEDSDPPVKVEPEIQVEEGIVYDLPILGRVVAKPLIRLAMEALPEGWTLESLTLNENLYYILENQEFFDPDVLKYVDKITNNAVLVYNRFILCVKSYSDLMDKDYFERRKEEILSENQLVKELVLLRKEESANIDSDEVDFAGDFDLEE
jgi:hypothetical protein